MASSPQSAQPIFFRHVVDATDEELTELILHHPWYIEPKDRWAEPPYFELEPGETPPSFEERTNFRERCWRLREKALAPPYPITKERLELAARWRRVPHSLPPHSRVPRSPFIGPRDRKDGCARRREKAAYTLLLELGGRPVHSLDRLFNEDTDYSGLPNRTEQNLQPWKHLHEHLAPRPYVEKWWESSILQLKNWERFRTWQRDHRGPNDQDNFQAFVQEHYRDWEIVRGEDDYSKWCLESEEQPTRLWSAWEKRQGDRATHREQGCGSFTDYSEAVRRRLEKNGFHHPFQLHPDPMQQDPLTTWIEYLAYEYWWLDHYTEAIECTQKKLREVWEKNDSHKMFKRDEGLVAEEPFKYVDITPDVSVFTYSPVYYFTTDLSPSLVENRVPWAQEVFEDAKSLSDIARAQVERERGREKADNYVKSGASRQLDRLREDCDKAKEEADKELKRFRFQRKYHPILRDLSNKTLEQVQTRHCQRWIVDWILDEFRLVEEEVRKLPGSSDIPMIAAKRGRKRARFTTAGPSIRLLPTIADAVEPPEPGSDEGRETKRRQLTLDAHPSSSEDRSRSSTSSVASRLGRVPVTEHDVSPATTDGGGNDEQDEEDERPTITGEGSGQDEQSSPSEHDVLGPKNSGSSNSQQEEDDGRQSPTGESSGQGATAEATSSPPTSPRNPEPQATHSPVQPDANEDNLTDRQRTPPASGDGDGQDVEQGAGGEQPAITAEVPAPAAVLPSPKAREPQPTRRSARIMERLALKATAPTEEPAARGGAEPQTQLKGKGKAKRPLSEAATVDADESRPKRRRTHTAKQADAARGSTAGQGTPSDGPGQHEPQKEETIMDCITVSLSSRARGQPATRGSRQAKSRKRVNRGNRTA